MMDLFSLVLRSAPRNIAREYRNTRACCFRGVPAGFEDREKETQDGSYE